MIKTCEQPGIYHTVALPFTLKSISRQKKNYGNSKYFTMEKYKCSKKSSQNPSRYHNSIITNLSSFNTSQNIIFQKSSDKNRPIIYYLGAKIP